MLRTITERCSCGYTFEVQEQVETKLVPGNYPHQTQKKEVIVSRTVLDKSKFKKIIVFAFQLEMEVKLLVCPKCNTPLLIGEKK